MSETASRIPTALTVPVGGALDWQSFDIPGGTEPVSLVTLRTEPDTRARTVLVRFPFGWRRPGSGFYEAAEDVVFLDGHLEMGGVDYRAGDWAYIPAGQMRDGSVAHETTHAIARFSAAPRWREGAGTPDEPLLYGPLTDSGAPVPTSPLDSGAARALHIAWPSSWAVDDVQAGARCPLDAEIVDVGARAWHWVPAGAPLPATSGTCFCRTFG